MILGFPFLILFPALATSNQRYWGISAKRRSCCYPVNNYRPPYEKLMSLKKWQQYLKPGIKADLLARQAKERSDIEAALRMQKAKLELLDKCRSMPR